MLTHEAASADFSESGERLPFPYDGGEFRLDYRFSLTGKMDTVGFLLFLDGQPQPYKVNDTTAEYEYCHSFPAKTYNRFRCPACPCSHRPSRIGEARFPHTAL